jgi:hypothetical protein
MNPAIAKLIERLGVAKNMAGAKAFELAGMAARNPKTAAGIGAAGAAGLGAGAAEMMDEDEGGESLNEIIQALLAKEQGQGQGAMRRGRSSGM